MGPPDPLCNPHCLKFYKIPTALQLPSLACQDSSISNSVRWCLEHRQRPADAPNDSQLRGHWEGPDSIWRPSNQIRGAGFLFSPKLAVARMNDGQRMSCQCQQRLRNKIIIIPIIGGFFKKNVKKTVGEVSCGFSNKCEQLSQLFWRQDSPCTLCPQQKLPQIYRQGNVNRRNSPEVVSLNSKCVVLSSDGIKWTPIVNTLALGVIKEKTLTLSWVLYLSSFAVKYFIMYQNPVMVPKWILPLGECKPCPQLALYHFIFWLLFSKTWAIIIFQKHFLTSGLSIVG